MAGAGDRLGHRLEWVPNGGADEPVVRLLESIDDIDDGGTTDDWPASPPLADWHIEERTGDRVLMAVGRAGRSHWSVVVTAAVAHARQTSPAAKSDEPDGARPAAPAGQRLFTPGGGPPHSLLMPGPAEEELNRRGMPQLSFDVACRAVESPARLGNRYRCPSGGRLVDPAHWELSPAVMLAVDAASTVLHFDAANRTLAIEPRPIASARWPQTICWRYWLSVAQP